MTTDLLPCPFCGGTGRLIESHRYDSSVDKTPPHWKVSCENVGCNGAAINIWRQSEEEAIAAWNARKEPDELPEWVKYQIALKIGSLEHILRTMEHATKTQIRRQMVVCEIEALKTVLSLRKPE